MADARTPDQIERDLAEARQRLADNLSELITQVHPKVVVHRTVLEGKKQAREAVDEGKRIVHESVGHVKKYFKDESGWRIGSVAVAAGTAVAVVAILVLTKKK
ncbi:MAG: DUF3618 domain-containing protein [Propionibacteriaceae bacterium]|nr:DUF3618 domain-containing protein [Propionibacteriaceae bacterium]